MGGDVVFTGMDEANARVVQNLNGAVLPLPYDERFYRQILKQDQGRYCSLAVVGKETVGAIVCTVDDKKNSLCIATLAVLAPHRRSGIGRELVRRVLSVAGEECLTTVCVHVQVGNDDALAFYASLGFVEVQVIPRYYPPRVQPRDCVLMEHRPLGR